MVMTNASSLAAHGGGVQGAEATLISPESWLTNHPGHLWPDKWTVLSGPLSIRVLGWQHMAGVCWALTRSVSPLATILVLG